MILQKPLSASFEDGDSLIHNEMHHRLESRIVKPSDRGPELVAAQASMLLVVVMAVSARAYTRKFIVKSKLRVDDFVILAAMVSFIGFSICQAFAITYGAGKHSWDFIPQEKYLSKEVAEVWDLTFSILYSITTNTTRISVLLFLFNLNPYKTISRLIEIFISIITFFMISSLALFVVDYFHSIRNSPGYWMMCYMNLVMDLMVWLLPAMLLSHVHGSLRKKVEIAGLLCLGLTACIANGIRIYYIYKLISNKNDMTWHVVDIFIWSSVEVSLGILCSCAPTAKQLFQHLRSKVCSQKIINCRRPKERERTVEDANTFPMVPAQSHTRRPRIYPESLGTSWEISEEYNGDSNSTTVLHATAGVALNISVSSFGIPEEAIQR